MGIRFFLRFNFPFFILIPLGRIRRAARTSVRMVISFSPSRFFPLASSRTRLGSPRICSSALSSITTTRSWTGIYPDSTFRNVVLPLPVPPLTNRLYPAFTRQMRKSAASPVIDFQASRSCMRMGCCGNRRMVITGPSTEAGGMIICTREPSSSLASVIGCLVLTIRLHRPAMRCTRFSTTSVDVNSFSHLRILPSSSTKTTVPFTIISVIFSSSRSSCKISSRRIELNTVRATSAFSRSGT